MSTYLCVCVCVCVCLCVRVRACGVCTYTHTYVYRYIHIHTYIHTYVYIHTYIYMYTRQPCSAPQRLQRPVGRVTPVCVLSLPCSPLEGVLIHTYLRIYIRIYLPTYTHTYIGACSSFAHLVRHLVLPFYPHLPHHGHRRCNGHLRPRATATS